MGKSRSGNKRQGVIMDYRRPKLVVLIEILITLLAWSYFISTLLLIGSALFGWPIEWVQLIFLVFGFQGKDIQVLLYEAGAVFVVLFVLQYMWFTYNSFRYGKYTRRKFPTNVESSELAAHFQITEEEVRYFQDNKVIKLKKRFF